MSRETVRVSDCIYGCVFGNAVGDAFGLATEFMDKKKAKYIYGLGPINFGKDSKGFDFLRDGHRSRWFENDFTDDTDQLLLILECILKNEGTLNPRHFAFRLKEWTQIGFPELEKRACGIGYTVGSVLSHPLFLEFPHKAAYDVWNSRKRNLAANGAIMRTSILGIPCFDNEEKVVENAINAAKVTHADPRSVVSAVIASVIIRRIIQLKSGNVLQNPSIDKVKLLKLLLNGTTSEDDDIFNYKDSVEMQPKLQTKSKPKEIKTTSIQKLLNFFSRPSEKSEAQESNYRTPEPSNSDKDKLDARVKTAAEILKNPKPSMDTFGEDEEMMKICREVVADYKFLIQNNPLCPSENTWTEELEFYCFPVNLESLALDESGSIGYTFKCLGSAIYAVTRAIPENLSKAKFFKRIITQLTLEGGDADTNCAVAGALLGCRLGLANLPEEWYKELRHYKFLYENCEDICSLIQRST